MPRTLVVDINHWLGEDGELPRDNLRVRRNALRVARFIEYGGPLRQLHGRESLLECRQRPQRKRCPGFMWVMKRADNRLQVFCPTCRHIEVVISGWEETLWADGMLESLPMTDD